METKLSAKQANESLGNKVIPKMMILLIVLINKNEVVLIQAMLFKMVG